MSNQDMLMLSTLMSAALGSIVLPWLVALIIRQQWTAQSKRAAALGISAAAGVAQWFIESVLTGKDSWHGLAITVPVIFTMATITYNRFWKAKVGPVAELDVIGKLIGAGDE